MNRNDMLEKVIRRAPGLYLHISFKSLWWIVLFSSLFIFAFIHSIDIRFNVDPVSYPIIIDGKMINFTDYKPKSIEEARDILNRYERKFKDGDFVGYQPERKSE